MPAPVVIFIYNRTDHADRVFAALRKNELFDKTLIKIYADGPRANASDQTRQQIQQARKAAENFARLSNVSLQKSEHNRGLARSIIDGVTETVNEHDRVIVLEDDIVPTPGFLAYMNRSLEIYSDEERVMQISAYMPPHKQRLQPTGFFRGTNSWGWATWQSAWKYYNDDAGSLYETVSQPEHADAFNICPTATRLEELRRNAVGDLRTWAVRWYASCFLRQGLTLYPNRALVANHGFDGTGENCNSDKASLYNGPQIKSLTPTIRPIQEDPEYLLCFTKFFENLSSSWAKPSLWARLQRKLKLR